MNVDIKLGKLLAENKEAKVVRINKKPGDKIEPCDVLLEVESDKINISVTPLINGILDSLKVREGDIVTPETLLAVCKGERIEARQAPAAQNKPQSAVRTFNYFGNLMAPVKEELEADIAIIGGGPGGYVAAIHAAKQGAKVVLVEKESLGGTCLNHGCIPTKSLVRSAEVFNTLKRAEEYGCFAENIDFNFKKIIERKNKVVAQLVSGIKFLMTKNDIKVVEGTGVLKNNNTVYIKTLARETTIKAKNIIIATGSKSASLSIKGVELKNVITSNDALTMKILPQNMVIVGGGVIGMEFAYIYNNFGVDITVIEYFDKCLASTDDDVAFENAENAKKKGIRLYTGSKVEEIIEGEDGKLIVVFVQNGERKYVTCEKVLMATGRIPYLESLGLENLGIELNENGRGIKVNSRMQTSIPNIYAIGDVTNKIMLAHVASHQGVVAVDNILGKNKEMDYKAVPSAIFTDPEIATVGIGEKEAADIGLDIRVGRFPYSANGKALVSGESSGFIKLIEENINGKIIGASIVGLHASDLIGEVTLAIKNGLKADEIIETIHAHPTTAEVIHEGALSLRKGAIHFA